MPKYKIFSFSRIINVVTLALVVFFLISLVGDLFDESEEIYQMIAFVWSVLYLVSLVFTIIGTVIHRRTLTTPENYGKFKKFLAITFLPLGLCVIGVIGALLWLSIELSGVSGA